MWTIAAEERTTSAKSEQERKEAATQRNGKETTGTRDASTRTKRGKRRLQFTKEPAKWTITQNLMLLWFKLTQLVTS